MPETFEPVAVVLNQPEIDERVRHANEFLARFCQTHTGAETQAKADWLMRRIAGHVRLSIEFQPTDLNP